MKAAFKSLFAIAAGVVFGGLCIIVVQAAGHAYHGGITPGMRVIVLISYLLGAFAAAFVANRIGLRSVPEGFLAGGVLLLLAAARMRELPQPLWFWLAAVLLFVGGAWIGSRIVQPYER